MKRMLCLLMILCIGAIGAHLVLAETEERGFGFGGAMAMAFFPDMSGINRVKSAERKIVFLPFHQIAHMKDGELFQVFYPH